MEGPVRIGDSQSLDEPGVEHHVTDADGMTLTLIGTDGRLIEQRALAAFIDEGHFTRHLRRMRVLYAERSVASYARSFTLPVEVDQAESSAKMEHGVLTLQLAKRGAVRDWQHTQDYWKEKDEFPRIDLDGPEFRYS